MRLEIPAVICNPEKENAERLEASVSLRSPTVGAVTAATAEEKAGHGRLGRGNTGLKELRP